MQRRAGLLPHEFEVADVLGLSGSCPEEELEGSRSLANADEDRGMRSLAVVEQLDLIPSCLRRWLKSLGTCERRRGAPDTSPIVFRMAGSTFLEAPTAPRRCT